ncbi:DNA modification methylase [Paenibacillus macerans]|uniref:DNA modification methylase n=1 Tax=Paenibacillus macerans TaxID=44252 RepID=UPI000E049952|nr:DNA modification methylase [Paenibacillus macerans]MBS5911181.1 DNA modification methylase [Paenibacillus macerans]MCY7562070.1 DNA modification methylase [Paenibacillus macerans]MEC0137573.1 DNA modification methylase [Paenibacillus macerans]MEC0153839.1 DNA modification methylase [Paenibacillus macerans]SUA86332.1 Uncharacterised protein [Paenibacillus macerans]
MLTSILSYSNRGKWGKADYPGNCSGHVIYELLEHYKPKQFVEVFAGGGTGKDVAIELGFWNSVHLDLNPLWGGWNALKDEVPINSDFIFSHPPYYNIILYSGSVWGQKSEDDLSRAYSYKDFINKLDLVNEKLFKSLLPGGRLAVLVGDFRRNGIYYSIIKDMRYFGQLEAHLIKIQHNCNSFRRKYKGNFIPIVHEHLLIFQK